MPMTSPKQQGFSMIELLIALLILAIGLFGMASLMLTSIKSNQSAAQRSQASWLAYDMLERMRLNSERATTTNDYVIAANTNKPNDPDCKTGGCTPTNLALLDKREWMTELSDNALTGTTNRNGNIFTVTVTWQEDSSRACANGQCSFTLSAQLWNAQL